MSEELKLPSTNNSSLKKTAIESAGIDAQDSNDGKTEITQDPKFYTNAKEYWSTISPTVDGMLGGFGSISSIDVRGSTAFLKELFKMKPSPRAQQALDCGAGIGRVAKFLLMPLFERVDMVEQDPTFAAKAREFIGPTVRLGSIFNVGLQEFEPEPKKYDVIWSQWVLGHLPDDDLLEFLKRCISGLSRNGLIVIKENVTHSDTCDVDEKDSSVTRPLKLFKEIIAAAGLRVVKMTKQNNFPQGLYSVYMLALRPQKGLIR